MFQFSCIHSSMCLLNDFRARSDFSWVKVKTFVQNHSRTVAIKSVIIVKFHTFMTSKLMKLENYIFNMKTENGYILYKNDSGT